MKKFCLIFIVVLSMFSSCVFGKKTTSSPCYKSTVDINDENFVYNVTFENGDTVNLDENNLTHTFLVINGNFEELPVFIENNISYVSAKALCTKTGAKYEKTSDNSYCIEGINIILLYADSDKISIDGQTETMPCKTKVIGKDFYIPLRYVAERSGYSVSYTKETIAPFNNPVIDINNRNNNISKEEAVRNAVGLLEECYNTFLKNKSLIENGTEETKETIKNKIENTQCIGETSSFWILKGPYILLVDKSSGETFVKYGNGKTGHGSYIESIVRIDTQDKDFFSRDYYLG